MRLLPRSADVWHDTVSAEIVAPEHYRHACLETALANLDRRLGKVVIFAYIGCKFRFSETVQHKLGQRTDSGSSQNKIDLRVRSPDLLGNLTLRRHAACYAYHQLRLFLLELFHAADNSENPVLRTLAHRAGVEDYKVGFVLVLSKTVTEVAQQSLYFFAVGNI